MAKVAGRRASIWSFKTQQAVGGQQKRLKMLTSEEIPLTSYPGGGSGRTTSDDTTDDESSPRHRVTVTSRLGEGAARYQLQYDTASSSYGGSPSNRSNR